VGEGHDEGSGDATSKWERLTGNAVHLGRNVAGRAAETRCVKRQDARDAKTLEEPAKALDEPVSELLAAAIEVHRILSPGFLESV